WHDTPRESADWTFIDVHSLPLRSQTSPACLRGTGGTRSPSRLFRVKGWSIMLTLPNLLTLSRILAVPILVFLLWKPTWWDYGITFVLYCLVGITDYFDGYLARAQGTVSRLGQFLDPIADKIMVVAVIAML